MGTDGACGLPCACGTEPRRGPPAALPRKACGGMLGAMVRVAQKQVVGARFIVGSCKRFIAHHKHISYS